MSTKTRGRLELQGQTAGPDILSLCLRWQNSNLRAMIAMNIRHLGWFRLTEPGRNRIKSAHARKGLMYLGAGQKQLRAARERKTGRARSRAALSFTKRYRRVFALLLT